MAIAKPAHGAVNWDTELNLVIDAINAVAPNGLNSDVEETSRDAVGAALTAGTNITSIVVNDPANTITINGIADATIDERARDAVGTALTAGTNISVVVDDALNTITVNHTGTNYSQANIEEFARDAVGAALTAGTNISGIVLDDPGNLITINGITDATVQELARDAVGTALTAGTGISKSVDDPGNTITINSTITQYTDEMARDAIGTALTAGAGITVTPNDPGDTIAIASSITQYTDEMARDAIGAALVQGANMTITVDDALNTITLAATGGGYSQADIEEFARDALGTALTAGTNITITPNDAANTITIDAGATANTSEGYPHELLYLPNWRWDSPLDQTNLPNLGVPHDGLSLGVPTSVSDTTTIQNYAAAPWLTLISDGIPPAYVQFRAPMSGATTSAGVGEARSEMREMHYSTPGALGSWNANVLAAAAHNLKIRTKVTHAATSGGTESRIVLCQIHDASAFDVLVYYDNGNIKSKQNDAVDVITTLQAYTLDTWINIGLNVYGNNCYVYLDDVLAVTVPLTGTGCDPTTCYFKFGCYNQENSTDDAGYSASDYNEVHVAAAKVQHGIAWASGGYDPIANYLQADIEEFARDALGTALTAGAGITVTPDDAGNTIAIASTITQYTDEMARDALGTALTAGAGITVTPDDPGNTIAIASTITQYTDEMARDALGTALTAGNHVSVTVNDAADTITLDTAQRVVAITDQATLAINTDTTDVATVTLGASRTMGAGSGSPVNGQKLIFRVRQDAGGSRAITSWNAIWRFSGGTAPTLTTTGAKTDYFGFIYNSTDSKWDCVAERLNF